MASPLDVDEPLAEAGDLTDFPGTFPASVVAAACESIRIDAGWHIAPSIESTETIIAKGGQWIFVRSLRLTAVTEIRDLSGVEPVVLTGYRPFTSGSIYLAHGWPAGAVLEIDMVDGYETCPGSLLPAIASRSAEARIDRGRGAVRLGSLSVQQPGPPNTAAAEAAQPDAIVSRFRIPQSR